MSYASFVVVVIAVLALCGSSVAATVGQVISARGCSTHLLRGLSAQLVQAAEASNPGLWAKLDEAPYSSCVTLSTSAAAVPFLQKPAADSLCKISRARGQKVAINSGLRTLPQQLALFKWQGSCGITVAAKPGGSNHNGGAAVDINDSSAWRRTFLAHGWSWQGSGDPVHYNWISAKDVRSSSVVAFQKLWNLNNPSDRLKEDGLYGSRVEAALLKSPVDGFPRVPSDGVAQPQEPQQPANDPPAARPAPGGPSCNFQGQAGTCMDVKSCDGTSHRGLCPGAANIQCCVPRPSCNFQGQAGTCMDVNSCDGTSHRGLCPGAANIQCCVPRPVPAPAQPVVPAQPVQDPAPAQPVPQQPAPPQQPAAPEGPSCSFRGQSGVCKDVGSCNGTPHRGLCPGASNIQCCVEATNGGVPVDPAAPASSSEQAYWASVVRGVTSHAKPFIVEGLSKHMPQMVEKFQINTPLRVAHFLAQCAHESASFTVTTEFASGAAYEGRRDLGNTQKGDGVRFKGRGLIQLTGRANYGRYGQKLGVDFVSNPPIAAEFPWAALTAGVYWDDRKINALADKDDVVGVTRKVNGGTNGLADRKQMLANAKAALKRAGPIPGGAQANRAAALDATAQNSSAPMSDWAIGLVTGIIGTVLAIIVVVLLVRHFKKRKEMQEDLYQPLLENFESSAGSVPKLTPRATRRARASPSLSRSSGARVQLTRESTKDK